MTRASYWMACATLSFFSRIKPELSFFEKAFDRFSFRKEASGVLRLTGIVESIILWQ